MTRCTICWNEKFFKENPDEIAVEVSTEYVLKEWVVCKNHKEELEEELKKEKPMAISCSGCGRPTTPRTVPKGPRGPWVANECLNGCMTPDGKYKLTTKAPVANAQPTPLGTKNSGIVAPDINRKLDQILAIL